jgi:GT2 family glycosyltransferase
MDKTKVAIVVVNLNRTDLTRECVRSIAACGLKDIEIVFVDNGSTDNSYDVLTEEFPYLRAIRLTENGGFTGGYNAGMVKALELHPEYVFLLNNDTRIDVHCIVELTRFMDANPELAACQPKILQMENPKQLDSTGQLVNPILLYKERGRGKEDLGQFDCNDGNIFSPKGAAFFVRSRVLKQVGFFDETYFANCEDIDLSWRIHLAGHRIGYCPASVVFHHVGSPTSSTLRKKVVFHSLKNQIRTLIKCYSINNLLKYLPLTIALHITYAIFHLLSKLNLDILRAVCSAFVWNISNIRNTLAERHRIQKMRNVEDDTIIKTYMMPLIKGGIASHAFEKRFPLLSEKLAGNLR